jgi:hypothetical protein
MEAPKRFHVFGRVRLTPHRKESDGLDYDLGSYDSREEAEAVRRERFEAGWGRVWIVDSKPEAPQIYGKS